MTRDDGSSSYGYDELYRLTGSSELNECYTYGGVGNRLVEQGSQTARTYNADHQLLATETTTFTYNAIGRPRPRVGKTLTYTYNLEERLVEVNSSVSDTIATYAYDLFGRRIRKTVGATTTYFHYDDTGLIAEYNGSGSLTSEYQYTPGSPWMTDPLFKRDSGTDTVHFYLNDHLGTPRKLFDSAGQITWAARYEAFGRAIITVQLTPNLLRLPGQYEDAETGTHYNYLRPYDADPWTGSLSDYFCSLLPDTTLKPKRPQIPSPRGSP